MQIEQIRIPSQPQSFIFWLLSSSTGAVMAMVSVMLKGMLLGKGGELSFYTAS